MLGDHIPYQDPVTQSQKKAEAAGKNQTLSDIAPQPLRTFHVNDGETNDKLFVGNQIVTSKYTVVNFLPKNLVDQFSKLANIYFLGMMILQVSTTLLTPPLVKFCSIYFTVLKIDNTSNLNHKWTADNPSAVDVRHHRICSQRYIRRLEEASCGQHGKHQIGAPSRPPNHHIRDGLVEEPESRRSRQDHIRPVLPCRYHISKI